MERTLIILKPDAVQRGLCGTLLMRFEQRGFRIVGMKWLQVPEELARAHYAEHAGKPFFEELVAYITASPVVVMALEGPSAIAAARATIGTTNPRDATPGSIRGDFALEVGRNLVHASDSMASAERELRLFFTADDLFDWDRVTDHWVFGK